MEALRTAVEDAVGHRVEAMAVVRGGDVAASFRVELADGRRLFAKTHPSAPPGFFSTEAASLAWLREADAVPVPSVVAVSDGTDTSPAFLDPRMDRRGPPEGVDRALARRGKPQRRVAWPSGRHLRYPVTLLDELAALDQAQCLGPASVWPKPLLRCPTVGSVTPALAYVPDPST